MRKVRLWAATIVAGIVAAGGGWTALDAIGYDAQMAAGLGIGAGVAAAALTGRWIEKRHQTRQMLAKFMENS